MQSYGGADRLLMDARGEPAGWLQTLRQWPMSVLLLDEIEKASPEVFDCLLGALDEGRITDRFGRTTTLCGTVVIMTSNVGATMSSSLGFDNSSAAELMAVQHRYSQALRETFRPEFLNRLDYVITFRPLTESLMRSLVTKELHDLARRETIVSRGVKLTWTEKLVDYYSRVGFDRQLGARPLQRKLEQELVANLAFYLLANPQAREIKLDTFCDGLKNFS